MKSDGNVSITMRITSVVQFGITALIFGGIFMSIISYSGVARSSGILLGTLFVIVTLSIIAGAYWPAREEYTEEDATIAHEKRVEYLFGLVLYFVLFVLILDPVLSSFEQFDFWDTVVLNSVDVSTTIGSLLPVMFSYLIAYYFDLRPYHKITDII